MLVVAVCCMNDVSIPYVFGMCLNSNGGVWDLGFADPNKAQGGTIAYTPIVSKRYYQVLYVLCVGDPSVVCFCVCSLLLFLLSLHLFSFSFCSPLGVFLTC